MNLKHKAIKHINNGNAAIGANAAAAVYNAALIATNLDSPDQIVTSGALVALSFVGVAMGAKAQSQGNVDLSVYELQPGDGAQYELK